MEDIYTLMKVRLDEVKPRSNFSHFPPGIVDGIERELLLFPTYVLSPPAIPPNTPESLGCRRLREPTDARYQRMLLRLGLTTLHIKECGARQNLEAAVLVYLGGAETVKIGEMSGKSTAQDGIVFLLDNGVVSALYNDKASIVKHVISWRPPGKDAGNEYPNTREDVSRLLQMQVSSVGGKTDTRALKALPDLVMFAVDTYKRSQRL